MLWTLYRYISFDLAVVFLLSLASLTSILALAGVLIRVRQEGLETAQIAMVFLYLLPVMLTVTLPFAALFSVTLVFGRMSGANEINACRANGIGLARLLVPPAVLAAATGGATFYLSNWTIPTYTVRVERAARDNFKSGLITRLRSRGWTQLTGAGGAGGRIIADSADPNTDPALMENAVLLITRSDARSTLVTARRMTMDFDAAGDRLRLAMYEAWVIPRQAPPTAPPERRTGKKIGAAGTAAPGGRAAEAPPTSGKKSSKRAAGAGADPTDTERRVEARKMVVSLPLPQRLRFRTSFGTLDELLALRREPLRHDAVRTRLAGMEAVHQTQRCRDLLQERFPEGRSASFTFTRPPFLAPRAPAAAEVEEPLPTLQYRLAGVRPAGPAAGSTVLALSEAVLEVFPAAFAHDPAAAPSYREFRAGSATVETDINLADDRNFLRIRLTDCTSARVRHGAGLEEIASVRRPNWVFDGLSPVPVLHPAGPLDYARILRESTDRPDAPEVSVAKAQLADAVARLVRDIDSHLHSRFASAACSLLFVFLGAALGVMCRTGDYVAALAISAVPGAITIGVIVLGRRVLADMARPELGMLTIWGGPALLLIADVWLWRRLLRR